MGLLSAVKSSIKATISSDPKPEEILPVVPSDGCDLECATCTAKYSSSLKFDRDTPLWGSVKPWRRHILIATGKSDWAHGLGDETGSLSTKLEDWSPSSKEVGRVIVSNSSMSAPQGYFEETDDSKRLSNLLILPTMYEARGVSLSTAQAVANRLCDIPNNSSDFPSEAEGATLVHRGYKAVILLCSHRTRDKRCGVTAPILKKELELHLREHGLLRDANDERPGGVAVFYVSHVGGHKFAGNVIVYRDSGEGVWMGLVEPKHCKAIVEETIINGRVYPQLLRGAFKSDW
ncbi:Sucrase/ferredoxin-like-domain-containing protein [Myxozyma melibiosi]|uniref:Sucrase/ferredoxin-like-domain-containing protein n=1 Tax=Myxozyma melibiosi TaxID=54550 RepID=A0ABR1FES0_9ASCO